MITREYLSSTFRGKTAGYLIRIPCLIYIIVYHVNCTSFQVKEGTFLPHHGQYTLDIPGRDWDISQLNNEEITLQHKGSQATIALVSSNLESEKAPLESLSERLFIGIKDKKVLLKEIVPVSGRQAMHTILEFRVNKQKLKMDSYIIRAGKTVFDLVFWAPHNAFDNNQSDFKTMVQSFKILE